MTRPTSRARLVAAALLVAGAGHAHAACNLIPSATQIFRSSLGAANRPYAAPGDIVTLSVDPTRCDVASTGLPTTTASDYIVTVVFTPPNNGQRRVVYLTPGPAGTCDSVTESDRRDTCEGEPKVASVSCKEFLSGVEVFDRDGTRYLSFRFPDTDDLYQLANDDRTLSGPVAIAVTPSAANAPLPCSLAATPCSTPPSGAMICVDSLFNTDGTCAPNLHPTFPSFTALPVPNDYQAECFDDIPPCTITADDSRYTVDAMGNLLLPVNWQGILASQGNVPVPRITRATVKSPVAFETPPVASLGSFTPEGAPLPPIFEPESGDETTPNTVTLFGSSDAAYTILRIARRLGVCTSGPRLNEKCVTTTDCGGPPHACETICAGGTAPANTQCSTNGACGPGGRCGALYGDFRPLASFGGPLVLARHSTNGICQLSHLPCTSDAQCPSDICVNYAFEATTAVDLSSLTGNTDELLALTVNEGVDLQDRNGDDDPDDLVVTLRDRTTGDMQPLGAATVECPALDSTALGRAVVSIAQTPFRFPAVATEDEVVAFLESEASTTTNTIPTPPPGCDENSDGDTVDAVLRAFKLGTSGELTTGAPRVADAEPVVNGRSLAVSGGRVFFRESEAQRADSTTVRVSDNTSNAEPDDDSVLSAGGATPRATFSATGRYITFNSGATDLIDPMTNDGRQIFVRDRDTDDDGIFDESGAVATELISKDDNDIESAGANDEQTITPDGRFVVFVTGSVDLESGGVASCGGGAPGNCEDVIIRDRCVANGMEVLGCTPHIDRVTVDESGGEVDGACYRPAVSDDGRYVAFDSPANDIVAAAANGSSDVFVRDRCESNGMAVGGGCIAHNVVVSVTTDGTPGAVQSEWPAISADGRFVAFHSAYEFDPMDLGGQDVYLHDRDADEDGVFDEPGGISTVLVSREIGGFSGGGQFPTISGDGRYVAYESLGTSIVPNDNNSTFDIFVWDRITQLSERVSVATDGTEGTRGSGYGFISRDGRYVVFFSQSPNLVTGDVNTCTGFPIAGECPDIFVRDRVMRTTKLLTVSSTGAQSNGRTEFATISPDNRFVSFQTPATNLVPAGGTGRTEVFVRGVDPMDTAADLTGDQALDDIVVTAFDTSDSSTTRLCPATRVAVAGGRTAFLRPEGAGATPSLPLCPAGGSSLNGPPDTDTTDDVVHLWNGMGNVENLRCAATDVVISSTAVAALVDEAAQGDGHLNGDGFSDDTVVKVYRLADATPTSCGAWQNTNQAGDDVVMCGSVVAFLTPELAQGTDVNQDGDPNDRVVQIWNPAGSGTLVNTKQAAEEIVCSDTLVAFRTREADQCPGGTTCDNGLNGMSDTDLLDDVLQTFDISRPECLVTTPPADCIGNSTMRVLPCPTEACDPRIPYRVNPRSVKFLTEEKFQGDGTGTDLNLDGDKSDLVIQVYNVDTNTVTYEGTASDESVEDPLAGGDADTGTVYNTTGRCIETIAGSSCTTDADCEGIEFCESSVCKREQGVCTIDDDCPEGITCDRSATRAIVPASADVDEDGISDHLDNCPFAANADQLDDDDDGVGNECDLATCGNGMIEYDEQCDIGAVTACQGGSCDTDNCTCTTCGTAITDPAATIMVKRRNDVGQLSVRTLLPLPDYADDQPVTLRLDDSDSDPLAIQSVGVLPARGTSGAKWMFKTRGDGVTKVLLKKSNGQLKLIAKAKHWFPAAEAADPASTTRFTVNVGTQCFTRAATIKVD